MELLNGNSFDNFIVRPSNMLPHAASIAVTKEAGIRYNPLVIYGGHGVGKTHLMQAIGNRLKETNSDLNIFYVPSWQFMKRVYTENGTSYMVDADVLLFDDVHLLQGSDKAQSSLFHVFNFLYEKNKQIVVTSGQNPNEIHGLQEGLRSRLQWGIIVGIGKHEPELRSSIQGEV